MFKTIRSDIMRKLSGVRFAVGAPMLLGFAAPLLAAPQAADDSTPLSFNTLAVRDAATPVRVHHFDPVSDKVIWSGSSPSVAAAAAGSGEAEAVYVNTESNVLFPPGPGRLIADDLFTAPGCDCELDAYEFLVGGGGTGGAFTVTFELFDGCPNGAGVLVPDAGGSIHFDDDGDHLVRVDLASLQLTKGASYWLQLGFSRTGAGWYSGAPAAVGFTGNVYDFPSPSFECTAKFPPTLYAGFHAAIYCNPQSVQPAESPSPVDGSLSDSGAPLLQWGGTGAGKGGSGQAGAVAADAGNWVGDWEQNVPAGHTCATMERYYANNPGANNTGGGAASVAGGCQEGLCDDPATRDFFIPNEEADAKRFRVNYLVFCNDDGTGCVADDNDIALTNAILNQDFALWRFDFVYETYYIFDSEFRNFQSNEEVAMKTQYAIFPEATLNIFVVSTSGFSFGTFPWDAQALQAMGGIVLHQGHVGTSIVSHEVGHNVGLWHTHHGVSEVPNCSACYERADGIGADDTGDFCSDTASTPVNFNCGNPNGTDSCSGTPWGATDYINIMGYAPVGCISEFSPQQAGRFHCWSQQVLLGWTEATGCTNIYDVYVGESNPPDQLICESITDTECQAPEFEPGTTVFWRVDTRRGEELVEGEVWSYTVPSDTCALVGSEPETCTIDSGQPSPPYAPGDRQGLTQLQLAFSCDEASLTADDFLITVDNGSTPEIVDVQTNGNELLVVLDMAPPAGGWTCVEFTVSGERVCIGVLPGDTNGDRRSDSLDILALTAALDEEAGGDGFDVDRSGGLAPEDLLRLIDVLNGAGDYSPGWWDRTLSECPN